MAFRLKTRWHFVPKKTRQLFDFAEQTIRGLNRVMLISEVRKPENLLNTQLWFQMVLQTERAIGKKALPYDSAIVLTVNLLCNELFTIPV